jgi:hypothetical protein
MDFACPRLNLVSSRQTGRTQSNIAGSGSGPREFTSPSRPASAKLLHDEPGAIARTFDLPKVPSIGIVFRDVRSGR